MKKGIIFLIVGVFFLVMSLSGCMSTSDFTRDLETCICIIIIFPIIFIILIAYLLGHKKTKIETVINQPPPVYPTVSYKEKVESKSKRRCPECGRVIPDEAQFCPFCGKQFKSYFKDNEDSESAKEDKDGNNKNKSEEKIKQPKYCFECGYKFEEENLDFCPKCGEKIK